MSASRKTRVLAHPDHSYTVEFEAEIKTGFAGNLEIPHTIKQWACDPGYAAIPGKVGQHLDKDLAIERAKELVTVDNPFGRIVAAYEVKQTGANLQ